MIYIILRKSPDDSQVKAVSTSTDKGRTEQVFRNIIDGLGEECMIEWVDNHRCIVDYHGLKFEYWIAVANDFAGILERSKQSIT